MALITKLVATIGKKRYRLVPAASCKGCAFEAKCYRADVGNGRTEKFTCPTFDGCVVARDSESVFKEIRG